MAVTLVFEINGSVQLSRRLEEFSILTANATPAFEAIADDFLRIERGQFGSEGARGSGGWAPLSDAYGAWKAIHYPDSPLLQKDSPLVNSLTWADAPGQIRDITPWSIELGTDVPYAQFHQEGTDRMPARPPVALTEADKVRWVGILHRWIITGGAV